MKNKFTSLRHGAEVGAFVLCFLCLFFFGGAVYAQSTVSGRVTSAESGEALPGVNVVVKGTTTGTITDIDGNYNLSVSADDAVLQFSFIGYTTQDIPVNGRSTINVVLASDMQQLGEVVVSALGLKQNRDELGSAVSQVEGNDISRSGEATLINGMAGRASGVNITRSSGDPGAGSYIQIRGQSTITGNLQPLIVVDGVPIYNSTVGENGLADGGVAGVAQQSRLNDLNPDDIASVEILKGASAAALWGTRAANGVIIVTTKKGSSTEGKIDISYSSTYSLDKVYLTHNLTNNWGSGTNMQYRFVPPAGYSWGDYIPDRAGGEDAYITNPEAEGYQGYFEAPDGTQFYAIPDGTAADPHGGKNSRETYNYEDYLFKTGSYWDNSLSLSGGDADGNFYLSLSNLSQQGVIQTNSDYKRTTVRFNGARQFNQVIRLSTNFGYSRVASNRVQMGSNVSGLYLGGLRTSPDFNSNYFVGTYYAPNGLIYEDRQRAYRNPLGARTRSIYDNPLWMMRNVTDRSEVDRFLGNFEMELSPLDWFTLTTRVGIDNYADRRETFFDPLSSANLNGFLGLETIRETQINADIFGRSTFTLTDAIDLTALVGMNFNNRQFDLIDGEVKNFIIQQGNIPIDLGNGAAENINADNDFSQVRTAALYSTLDFSLADMVFVNLTGRAESASTFGDAAQSTFFYPSASVAWQFTELLPKSNVLSFGKLRAGFGTVGVQPQPYFTRTYYEVAQYEESWGPTLDASAYGGGYTEDNVQGNPELKPERKTEVEVGTDLRFFNDRISLGATYFANKTVDALLFVATAPSTGFTSRYTNAGSLQNRGVELDLGVNIISSNNLNWSINGNWSRYRNKVTDLAGTTSLFLNGFTGTSSRAVLNQPIGVLWGGDFQRDDAGELILDSNGFPQAATEESVIGDPNPDWKAGIGSTLNIKNFSLNVLFDMTVGGDIWAGTHGVLNHFGRSLETDVLTTVSAADAANVVNVTGQPIAEVYPANADGSYTFRGSLQDFGGGDVALDQAWYSSTGGGFGPVSSQFIYSATNYRLRELSLSYSINSEGFRNATKLSSVEFSVTGRNLFIWGPDVDVIGNDPETNLTGPSNGRGLDYFNNPATRSFLFSVRINY